MVKCYFCGKEEAPFRGLHLIKNDGTIAYFCSSKCRKNELKLGRTKKKLKWTEAFRIAQAHTREEAAKAEKKKAEKEALKNSKK